MNKIHRLNADIDEFMDSIQDDADYIECNKLLKQSAQLVNSIPIPMNALLYEYHNAWGKIFKQYVRGLNADNEL